MKVIMMIRSGPRLCCSLVYWRLRSVALWSFSCLCFCFRITRRRHDAEHHQLPVADLRPAGSGSHGQRLPRQTQGRNQQNRSLTGHWAGRWRVTERVTDGSLTGQSDADLWSCQVLWTIQAGWNQTRSHRTDRWSGLKQMNVKIQNFGSDVTK